MILRLGCGLAARHGCGSKASLLDRAARAGLPVPPGVLVLDEAWRFALDRGLVRAARSGARHPISVPDPSLLLHLIGLPSFTAPLAIRAAFTSEDGTKETLAGEFVPGLFVDGRRPAAVAAGLAGVWAAAFRRPRGFRRDVIVQEMALARRGGSVLTEREHEDDLMDVTDGTNHLPRGEGGPRGSRALPKRRWGEGPTEDDPLSARLQALLRRVRRVFGEEDWMVEWADDDRKTWIIQIGPATPSLRNEAFTTAGHREILPDPPSRLTTSLIASAASDLFTLYRQFDPRLPKSRPLVQLLHGRPCLNLSLLTDMTRRWGLPTGLVTDSIGGVADRDFGLQPLRLLRNAPALFRMAGVQLRSVSSAAQLERRILERTESPPVRLDETLEGLRWLYTALAREMLVLTAALSGPLALLRRWGGIGELARRWRGSGAQMLEGLAELGTGAARRPELTCSLRRGKLPEDAAFREAFEAWLVRFGHYGFHMSDVARPRFREDPAPVLRSLAPPPVPPPVPPRRSLKGRLLRPLSWQVERMLRARESLRSSALVGLERLRRSLLALARGLVEDGVLPSADALFQLDVDEIKRIDEGFRPDAAFWEERRAEIEALASQTVPAVFHRLDDLETPPSPPDRGRMEGVGLSGGRARGRAWVATDPVLELPEGFDSSNTILVTRTVDLGWLVVFSRVAGVVVELGGHLSHGSIVLAELGLPSVTNVGHATHQLRTGDFLEVRADEGVVERLGSEGS